MIIISQTKDVVVNSENVFAFYIDDKYDESYKLKAHGNFKGSFTLGNFKTRRQAEEVLLHIVSEIEANSTVPYYV